VEDGVTQAEAAEGDLVLVNRQGLHARPSQLVVKTCNAFNARIQLRRGEIAVDGKSIMGVLLLGADKGSVLRVRAEGPDARKAVEALQALFASGFGEPI